jgi:hypothetical protein
MANPDTTPELLTVATVVLEDDHTPPEVPFVSVVVPATHTELGPVIEPAAGPALTVTIAVTLDPESV